MKRLLSALKLLLTLKCEQSTRIISQSLDQELSSVERWAVRLHYLSCYSCRRFGVQIHQLKTALRMCPEKTSEDLRLPPEAVQRIEDAIRKEAR